MSKDDKIPEKEYGTENIWKNPFKFKETPYPGKRNPKDGGVYLTIKDNILRGKHLADWILKREKDELYIDWSIFPKQETILG